MAQPFPRVIFTMPGNAPGVADEDINMISVDNDTKAPILTILNAATTNNGVNPNVAVGLMGHTTSHVGFKPDLVKVGTVYVPYDDGSVRTTHVKAECAARGLHNGDTARPKQGPIDRLRRSNGNTLTADDVLWFTPEDEQRSIRFIDNATPEYADIIAHDADYQKMYQALPAFLQAVAPDQEPIHPDEAKVYRQALRIKLMQLATISIRVRTAREAQDAREEAAAHARAVPEANTAPPVPEVINLSAGAPRNHPPSQKVTADISTIQSKLEYIEQTQREIQKTRGTLQAALATTVARQRESELRAAAADGSVYGTLRTSASNAVHELEDIKHEITNMHDGDADNMPVSLQDALQKATSHRDSIEAVYRIFPAGGAAAEATLDDLKVRTSMSRNELADHEAILKRLKTGQMLVDPAKRLLDTAPYPTPTSFDPRLNYNYGSANMYGQATAAVEHQPSPYAQTKPALQLTDAPFRAAEAHQGPPHGGGMGRGRDATRPAWAKSQAAPQAAPQAHAEHPELVGKPPRITESQQGPRIVSMRGLPYFIANGAATLGAVAANPHPPENPCRFCTGAGHRAFQCPTLLRWLASGIIDDKCYLK